MGYKVKLNMFEGPFDLLVYLIESAKMSIYDIEIAKITDQYVAYIEKMKIEEVVVATEFMVLAATLLEIKSKMLLPRTNPDLMEGEEEDPRSQLVEKLREYKRFKLLAEMLEQQELINERILEKPQEDLAIYTNKPDEFLTLSTEQFIKAFNLFLHRKQKVAEIRRHMGTKEQRETTELRIKTITDFFRRDPKRTANFKELVQGKKDKYNVALTFTSVLEMVRIRKLVAEQKHNYGDIIIKATKGLEEESTRDQ